MARSGNALLRFWIGRHVDGTGSQCIVDTDGGPMEGVKQAWNRENPQRLTTMEAVIEPELSLGSAQLLGLVIALEKQLGNPVTPRLHKLLEEIAMAAYEAGRRNPASR